MGGKPGAAGEDDRAIASQDTDSLHEPVRAMLKMFLFSAILALAIAFVATYVMTYQMTKPLREMSAAAKQYAKGDFSNRISVPYHKVLGGDEDEVAELVTAFNSMANALSAIETSRRNFVANVSHELKTPMTTIGGFIDGILDGTIDSSKSTYYLRIVSDEVKRLSRLVTGMLNMSKIEAGQLKIQPKEFDISAMTFKTMLGFERVIDEKKIEIRGLDKVEPLNICADEDMINQVIYNLIDNAVKFTNEGGYIEVAIKSDSEKMIFSVKNSGKGISREEAGKVFERFYKTDKSRSYDVKGAEAATEAFARIELNEAWYRRLTENRRVIAAQLDAMAELMEGWCRAEKCIDKKRRLRLSRVYVYTKEAGIQVENAHIYENVRQQICIKADVCTKADGGIEISRYVQSVSRAMGMKLRQAQGTVSIISDERTSIVLYEENQFYALSGVATKKKTGSQANGDSCSMFQLDDGMYHVCVSDGMGSGKQAQAESTLVVDLLEKLLEAGFSRESALKLMNSAMVISAGEESYSTVDFATIDMYTGELELAKTGAAPSFIKSGKQVSVIENESLPAGVDAAQESIHSKNTLQSGDFLVMVTDGVLEYLHVKDRQGKFMDIIAGVKSDNAGVMAQEILDRVLLDTGGYAMDDMTVVAIGIWEK